jgi:YVTN family beta-propeller protein
MKNSLVFSQNELRYLVTRQCWVWHTLIVILILLTACQSEPEKIDQVSNKKQGHVRLYAVDRYESVRRLHPETLTVIDSIDTGARPHGIVASPDGRLLYITVETSNELLKVDVATHDILARVDVGPVPNEPAITKDGRFVFVPQRGGHQCAVVDTKGGMKVVKMLPAGRPQHNAYTSHNGERVYVTSMGDNLISVIDPVKHEILRKIDVGGIPRPVALKHDESLAYVALSSLTGFITLDLKTDTVIDRLELPTPPGTQIPPLNTYTHGMLLTPDERELWVATYATDKVYGFLVPERKQIAAVSVASGGPHWLTVHPDGEPLYVSLERGGEVASIHRGLREVLRREKVGKAPTRILAFRTPVEDRARVTSSR